MLVNASRGLLIACASSWASSAVAMCLYWATRDRASPRSFSIWYVLARLRPGTGWQQAQSEMTVIGPQLEIEHPENRNLPEIQVVPLSTQTVGRVRLSLFVLFGSVFLMLSIACTNVANLLLARGSARAREFSVRRALGAGRTVLAAQVLTESLVLSVTGGALGLGLADASLRALISFGPRDLPRREEAHIDPRVLLFTLLLSLFAATTSALWPAMRRLLRCPKPTVEYGGRPCDSVFPGCWRVCNCLGPARRSWPHGT